MSSGNMNYRAQDYGAPANRLVPVNPADDRDLPVGVTRGLYVSSAGDLSVMDAFGNIVLLQSAGSQYHPIRVLRVRATGTTATGVVALY